MSKFLSNPLSVFVVVLSVFFSAPVTQMYDSKFTFVVSQSLLEHGSFKLDHYVDPALTANPGFKLPQEMEVRNGHVYYFFPAGSAVLSLPYVALMKQFGISAIDENGSWNREAEARMQRGLASLLMAGLAAVIFASARTLLPLGWSWGGALISAFGTQIFSSASRGLWSLTWGILILGIVIRLLMKLEEGSRQNAVVLATLLSWLYFVRPSFNIDIVLIALFIFFSHREMFGRFAVTGLVWIALFFGYSLYNFGGLLPTYYLAHARELNLGNFPQALAGILLSPSRGLLVFSPFLLVVFFLNIRYFRFLRLPRIVWLATAAVAAHLMLVASFPEWWGGHSYGPRLLTDTVPWLALLTISGADAMRMSWNPETSGNGAGGTTFWRRLLLAFGLLSMLFSIFTHSRGAFSPNVHGWNLNPNVDRDQSQLWNWANPQFMSGITVSPKK